MSAAVAATEYTIDTLNDVELSDGLCSLREAVAAINTREPVDTCPAGKGTDTVLLDPGATYQLDPAKGELVIGGELDAEAQPIDPVVVIIPWRKDVFDDLLRDNPVVVAGDGARIFNVRPGATLTLKNLTLQGGATGPAGNGGLILSEGQLSLSRHMILRGGTAAAGGGVYLSGSRNFGFDTTSFEDNTATTTNGGAIATDPGYTGWVIGSFFYFANNLAQVSGGGIALEGDEGVALNLSNGTFYANGAGTGVGSGVALLATSRATRLNNVTLAGNDAGEAVYFAAAAGAADDTFSNSVLVGNEGGSCGGDVASATVAYVVHDGSLGACPVDSDAAVVPYELPGNNSSGADFTVLQGVLDPVAGTVGDCPPATGSAACAPLEFDGSWPGFLPSLVAATPSVRDAGSPGSSVVLTCETTDSRSLDRRGRCDAGAAELQVAKGAKDEFGARTGVSTLLDVAANDVGDLELVCADTSCLTFERAPAHGSVSVELDGAGYPLVRYRSEPGFKGVDSFRYRISQTAFAGGVTYDDKDVAADANVIVTTPSTARSESIGFLSPLLAGLLVVLGLLRRYGILAGILVGLSVRASATDIQVNSLLDSLAPPRGDGSCTLREALDNATDESPLYSPDCTAGATGRDRVLVPEGVITLAGPLEISESIVTIEGVGAYTDIDDDITDGDPSQTPATILDGNGATVLIDASSPVTLRYLSLRNGFSSSSVSGGGAVRTSSDLVLEYVSFFNNSARVGGAVYLEYTRDESHALRMTRAEFNNNTATEDGGALAMLGQNQRHDIVITDSSFISNSAGARGGAIDANLSRGGRLRVINTTFASNSASAGAAIDLADIAAPTFIIGNTFYANGPNTLELGLVPPPASVRMSNTIFGASGPCAQGAGVTLSYSLYNVYQDAIDPSCDGTSQSNNDTIPAVDLTAVLNGGVLVRASGQAEEFVTAHFPLDTSATNAAVVVDAGNPGDLVFDSDAPDRCRAADLRGSSRESGGQCDRGAYELQVPTAVDDQENTRHFKGRYFVLDVLRNDLAGDNGAIVTNSIDLDPLTAGVQPSVTLPSTATVRAVERADGETSCGTTPGPGGEDCVVRYEASPALTCGDLTDYSETFTYGFTSNVTAPVAGPVDSTTATVKATVVNAAPYAPNVRRRANPGRPVVFSFEPQDYDAPPAGPQISGYKLDEEPILARYETLNGEKQIFGVGVVMDEAAGTVTYYPKDITKSFDDSFTISYEDECGDIGKTVFTVDYDEEDVGGASLAGSVGWWWLGVLVLLRRTSLLRRPLRFTRSCV